MAERQKKGLDYLVQKAAERAAGKVPVPSDLRLIQGEDQPAGPPIPKGLPTIQPDINPTTMQPMDYREQPGGISQYSRGENFLKDIRAIGRQPIYTLGEAAATMRRGNNPIAAGLQLARAVPEAFFSVYGAADRVAREWGPTEKISKAIEKPFRRLQEGIDALRDETKYQLAQDAQMQGLWWSKGINPKRAEEIIDETFAVGSHVAALAAFAAAHRAAVSTIEVGAKTGVGRAAVRGVGRGADWIRKTNLRNLSESIDADIAAKATADIAPLPDLPPGGIPGVEPQSQGPQGRGIAISPEGVAVPQTRQLQEPKYNIGGFMVERPKRVAELTPNPNTNRANQPRRPVDPMLIEGVRNVVGEAKADVRVDGYQTIIHEGRGGFVVTDRITQDTWTIPFDEFNAQSLRGSWEKYRQGIFNEMEAYGIGTIEEYAKLVRSGQLKNMPRKGRDLSTIAYEAGKMGDRPPEPTIPPPTPPPPAPPPEGGVPGESVRPIQALFTQEGRISTGSADANAPRPAEPNLTPPVERPMNTGEVPPVEPPQAPAAAPAAPAEAPKPPAAKPKATIRKIEGESQNAWVKISDITTRLEKFQERERPYAEETVQSIIDAVKNDRFVGREKLPPIEVWVDPATGELVNLSGHSRVEAYRRLVQENPEKYGDFNEIRATVHKDMTFEQAKAVADASNLGAQATLLEKAKKLREMRNAGTSEADIEKFSKGIHQANSNSILKLSALEPNSRVLDDLRSFYKNGVLVPEGREVLNMAEWIGELKRNNPGLNSRHEGEIYDFLKKHYKTAGKKFRREGEFVDYMDKVIKKKSVVGKVDDVLNLDNLIPQARTVEEFKAEINKEIDELNRLINQKKAVIARKLSNYVKKGLPEDQQNALLEKDYADIKKWDKDIAVLENRLDNGSKAIERSEQSLFDAEQSDPSMLDALKEAAKRLKEGGITPDGLAAGIPFDATKAAFIIEPILDKLMKDAQKLVQSGSIAQNQMLRWISRSADEILAGSKVFRELSPAEQRKLYGVLRDRVNRTRFDVSTGTYFEVSRLQYDRDRNEHQESIRSTLEADARNADPNKPNLQYDDGNPALYKSRNLDGTLWGKTRRLFFERMGKYVGEQTMYGKNLVETFNFIDRRAGQWAEKYLVDYTRLSKNLTNKQYDDFVKLADEGGTSPDFHVQQMLEWWRGTAKEIITRAKAAGMETSYAEITKNILGQREINVVTRPIGEREFYFPHEYDFKQMTDPNSNRRYIESIAKREGISMSEASDLFNKYLKHRSEMKYGHLEKPRLAADDQWSRQRDVIPSYIERSTRRILTAENLGSKNVEAIKMIDKISEHGGDAWAAKELLDRWLGVDYPTSAFGDWAFRFARKSGSWQVATKLQLLAILNPSQMNNTGLVWGTHRLIRESMGQFKNFDEWRQFAHEAAAITDQTVSMHMKEAYSMEGIGGKVMDWTKVKFEERLLRANAAAVGGSVMKKFGTRLNEPKIFKETESMLRILQLDKQIDLNQVKAAGGFSKQQLLDIGFESARSTQFLSRPQDMPTFFSTPEMKLFNQFKSFAIQQSFLVKDVVLEDLRSKNPVRIARTLQALGINYPATGLLVGSIRDAINGKNRDEETKLQSYIRNMAMVGSMGILYDMLTQSSYNQLGFNAYLAGPTVGDASKLIYSIMNPEYLGQTAAQQIPIPGLQQLMKAETRPDKSKIGIRQEQRQKQMEKRDEPRKRRER